MIMKLQQTSWVSCTTGGSLQFGSGEPHQTPARAAALPWGRHRPYEGSQQHCDLCGDEDIRRHRPYEGSQRHDGGCLSLRRDGGRHRPYEGSQRGWLAGPGLQDLRRHRPYEGSQRCLIGGGQRGVGGRHRPYEGSQHAALRVYEARSRVVIAPTRGRNPKRSLPAGRPPTCRHRPYEGSQQVDVAERLVAGVVVVIAPTRGRNPKEERLEEALGSRHRPYEGSQRHRALDADAGGRRRHRPYEGSQLRRAGRTQVGQLSSSPLREVATLR